MAGHLLVEPRPAPAAARPRRRPGRRRAPRRLGRRHDDQPLPGAGARPQHHLAVRKPTVHDSSSTSGWATRHGPMRRPRGWCGGGARTARRRHARTVRAASGRPAGPGPRPPRRRGAPAGAARPATTAALSRRWAPGSTCCQSQPPQPSATNGHGGATRSARPAPTSSQPGPGESFFCCTDLDADRSPGRAPGHEHHPAASSRPRPRRRRRPSS